MPTIAEKTWTYTYDGYIDAEPHWNGGYNYQMDTFVPYRFSVDSETDMFMGFSDLNGENIRINNIGQMLVGGKNKFIDDAGSLYGLAYTLAPGSYGAGLYMEPDGNGYTKGNFTLNFVFAKDHGATPQNLGTLSDHNKSDPFEFSGLLTSSANGSDDFTFKLNHDAEVALSGRLDTEDPNLQQFFYENILEEPGKSTIIGKTTAKDGSTHYTLEAGTYKLSLEVGTDISTGDDMYEPGLYHAKLAYIRTLPFYTIAASPKTVLEGTAGNGNKVTYTVTRGGDLSHAGKVGIDFSGTADAKDYTLAGLSNGMVSFAAGASKATFTLTTKPDTLIEPDETVYATIGAIIGEGSPATPQSVTVIIRSDDHVPTDIALSNTRVNESAKTGTKVGTLSAHDKDAGDTFTFRLLDDAEGRFALSGSTLKVADGKMLDYEQDKIETVKIRATDSEKHAFDKTLKIFIKDINPESITGSSHNDSFVGGAKNDRLSGAAGNDTLDGGRGSDILNGGIGRDTFFFSTKPGSTNVDHIRDFKPGEDTIKLDHSVFKALQTGDLYPGEFALIQSANDVVGNDAHVLYDTGHGALYYDPDGGSAAGRIEFAVLDNHASLTYKDFLIV